ncbi:hypothetical protein DSO57_1015719 [Entomophthora muscae]|uniref:Uncharacterized protein n=1 Tax=Entomophthora muscae TaxID=34485 RepID=A0ACC2RW97_9FUNG|nr:hypothetical protein DSO57_1015719 [Entomophthora muscae]
MGWGRPDKDGEGGLDHSDFIPSLPLRPDCGAGGNLIQGPIYPPGSTWLLRMWVALALLGPPWEQELGAQGVPLLGKYPCQVLSSP